MGALAEFGAHGRRRGRRPLLAITSCAASAASSDGATGATSRREQREHRPDESGHHLALGDSVPFGFRGGLAGEYQDADNFVGYPELVGR